MFVHNIPKMHSKKGHKMGFKIIPKMNQNAPQNGPKMDPKTGPKTTPKTTSKPTPIRRQKSWFSIGFTTKMMNPRARTESGVSKKAT